MSDEDVKLALDALIAITIGGTHGMVAAQAVSALIMAARSEGRDFSEAERAVLHEKRRNAMTRWDAG